MRRSHIYFLCLILLTSCGPSNTVFLGPSITAAKTESLVQTGLSYTSNKALADLKKKYKKSKDKVNSVVSSKNIENFKTEYEKKLRKAFYSFTNPSLIN